MEKFWFELTRVTLLLALMGLVPMSGFAADLASGPPESATRGDWKGPVSEGADPASLKTGMALYQAARSGRIETAEALIARGVDVNFREPLNGFTLLHAAVSYIGTQPPDMYGRMRKMDSGHIRAKLKLAELLIAKGAEVNSKSRGGMTPLHEAGSAELAQLLIAHGAGVDAETADGATPLFFAAGRDKEEVEMLLAHGANVNHKLRDGRTPLDVAVNVKEREMVAFLIARGADVNVRDRDGATLLERTISEGSSDRFSSNGLALAKLLLASGAKLNVKPGLRLTELHWAVVAGDPSLVEQLLAVGASLNAEDRDGRTPMSIAIENDNLPMAELLISLGSDVNARDRSGKPLLLTLVQQQRYALAEVFLRNKAEVNNKGNSPKSALFEAVELDAASAAQARFPGVSAAPSNGSGSSVRRATALQFIDLLISYGADVNEKNDLGETPLHLAFTAEVARRLIREGVPVNAPRKDGATPLHRAVSGERAEVVWSLLANRAKVNAKDAKGETPLHQVKSGKMVRTLLSRGAAVDVRRADGATPLHLAAVYGRPDVARMLVARGANVNVADNSGNTPLSYITEALERRDFAVVAEDIEQIRALLLGHGAKSATKIRDRQSPDPR